MDNGASSYRRFLAGDDTGIVEIVRDYKDGLMLFLDRYVGNIHIAEDLTEDTFVCLVTKKPRFTETYAFKTWLYTIGRNKALNYLKHSCRETTMSEDTWATIAADTQQVESAYLRKEQYEALYQALSRLGQEYAAVLHLKFFEEMSNEQIARVLKKSKRQVENLLYRAKTVLKEKLKQEGIFDEGLF